MFTLPCERMILMQIAVWRRQEALGSIPAAGDRRTATALNKPGLISEPRDDLLQEIPDLTCD